jgi:formamidopyrimidine-DNA glycosylase
MPELPEVATLAHQLNQRLPGKRIRAIEIAQPKCLNLPEDEFRAALVGAVVESANYHGKWIQVDTSQGWLLLNLGMGGELLIVPQGQLPDKRRVVFAFEDGDNLSINFWWFGYAHYAPVDGLRQHPMLAKLGPNVLDVTPAEFTRLVGDSRGRVKDFLLNQSKLAGIGNAYVHDILWMACLHPLRPLNTLSADEIARLYQAIQDGLRPSLEKGGAFYEMDTYGKPGGFQREDIQVGYREGEPCPVCGTPVEKIKTGSTSSFICPVCQPLEPPA